MSKTIFLDAGHGGHDPGAVGSNGRLEKDDNLRTVLALQPRLQAQGFSVEMSRETDIFVSINERVRMANVLCADLFVSCHRNGWHTPDAHGTEMVVSPTPSAQDMALSSAFLDELAQVGVQRVRGIQRGNFGVLRDTRMPSVMTEIGFVSNIEDNRLFDKHFDAYIEAQVRAICYFFGVEYSAPGGGIGHPNMLYRIQLGAFASRENAEGLLEQIRAQGHEAFLIAPEIV